MVMASHSTMLLGVYGGFEEWITHFLEIKKSPLDGALPDSEELAPSFGYVEKGGRMGNLI